MSCGTMAVLAPGTFVLSLALIAIVRWGIESDGPGKRAVRRVPGSSAWTVLEIITRLSAIPSGMFEAIPAVLKLFRSSFGADFLGQNGTRFEFQRLGSH